MHDHIAQWIHSLTTPQSSLNGHRVCPFAKKTNYKLIQCDLDQVRPDSEPFELIIFHVGTVTPQELAQQCQQLNRCYPDFIFLPDHKDRNTFIKQVQTNNQLYNLILCQPRDKLLNARVALGKTDYYTHWDPDYLNEILGT
jgi:hypothetical protein